MLKVDLLSIYSIKQLIPRLKISWARGKSTTNFTIWLFSRKLALPLEVPILPYRLKIFWDDLSPDFLLFLSFQILKLRRLFFKGSLIFLWGLKRILLFERFKSRKSLIQELWVTGVNKFKSFTFWLMTLLSFQFESLRVFSLFI